MWHSCRAFSSLSMFYFEPHGTSNGTLEGKLQNIVSWKTDLVIVLGFSLLNSGNLTFIIRRVPQCCEWLPCVHFPALTFNPRRNVGPGLVYL